MNIFYLDSHPTQAARYHCDKHVVKMIVETAQLLCTAHRILDGEQQIVVNENGHKRKVWVHPDIETNQVLYRATHINHPSAVWVRQSYDHYMWAYTLMVMLNYEFVERYNKTQDHATIRKLGTILAGPPVGLNTKVGFKPPPQVVSDDCKDENTIYAYREYYRKHKKDIAKWKSGEIPDWFHQQ